MEDEQREIAALLVEQNAKLDALIEAVERSQRVSVVDAELPVESVLWLVLKFGATVALIGAVLLTGYMIWSGVPLEDIVNRLVG